jgi:outer membrane biosynthesis protein TonB
MPLARGIVELLEAIPERIEVSGDEPTWRVTGGSFESVVSFAAEAFDEPVVVAREDRRRWWPRVTLTVTKDPELAASAPPLESLADPEPQPDPEPAPEEPAPEPAAEVVPVQAVAPAPEHLPETTLEDMFAYQDEVERSSRRVPEQRLGGRRARHR